ncbi:MAG: hypothetical protein KDD37_08810, partial [Bdellovibrionales bacterium]|nr:hypothetical protein [Bdellovibrionales bacterium]
MIFLFSVLTFYFASATDAPLNICYFSLNNEKEFGVTKNFIDKLNKNSPRKIQVQEFMSESGTPENDFQKLVESGTKCDGLVISGHHTGSFGGARANGSLEVDFLEKLSCNDKYKDWFSGVKALWLQGCRTMGVGKIEATQEGDLQFSADFHTERVGAVLEEDHLNLSFADLNMEFSATLDQDNPLSERYLRIFPTATTFGWTRTAPGVNARSELSLLYHMAHMAQKENYYDVKDNPIIDPLNDITPKQAVELATAVIDTITKPNDHCEASAIDAWIAHGTPIKNKGLGFSNPDL